MKLYIGETIKKLRTDKNVTQDTLAEYLGVSYQAVSRWETGTAYPDIELLPEIAAFFEISIDELMGVESDYEKIDKVINECLYLRETDKPTAIAKLHELERKFPNNWKIKSRICHTLIHPKPDNYEEVLPELRVYAEEAKENCRIKDISDFQFIASVMLKSVPEKEIGMWKDFLPEYQIPNYNLTMLERYLDRNDNQQAIHHASSLILNDLGALIFMFSKFNSNPEEVISSGKHIVNLIDAVIGTPYVENGNVHNSILLETRAIYQMQLSAAYIDSGKIDMGLDKLEKAVDLLLMYVDALSGECFSSDSCYIEDKKFSKERIGDEFFVLDSYIKDLTEWDWLDTVQNNERLKAQIKRLTDKKEKLLKVACKANI